MSTTYEAWIHMPELERNELVFTTTDTTLLHDLARAVERAERVDCELTIVVAGKQVPLPPHGPDISDDTDVFWEYTQADELPLYEIVYLDDDDFSFRGILCRYAMFYDAAKDLINDQLPFGAFGIRERKATLAKIEG